MPLVIENGSVVDGANSFATVAECRAFAALRGLALPADDLAVEVLLVKAADYLLSLETKFQGRRLTASQELLFPRSPVFLFGETLPPGTIPKILIQAQCQLAYDASKNTLLATGSGRVVKRTAVGPLSTEYADSENNPQVKLTAALSILEPLFNHSATGGINLFVDR